MYVIKNETDTERPYFADSVLEDIPGGGTVVVPLDLDSIPEGVVLAVDETGLYHPVCDPDTDGIAALVAGGTYKYAGISLNSVASLQSSDGSYNQGCGIMVRGTVRVNAMAYPATVIAAVKTALPLIRFEEYFSS